MARHYLKEEQKATIERMVAEGKEPYEVAKAIGKELETVKHYINGHIFDLRDKSGRMPDGTPKAGREPVKREPEPADTTAPTTAPTTFEVALDAMPESVKEPETPEVQPYRDWIIERVAVLQNAMIEHIRTMQELPEEWVQEYNRHIATPL